MTRLLDMDNEKILMQYGAVIRNNPYCLFLLNNDISRYYVEFKG